MNKTGKVIAQFSGEKHWHTVLERSEDNLEKDPSKNKYFVVLHDGGKKNPKGANQTFIGLEVAPSKYVNSKGEAMETYFLPSTKTQGTTTYAPTEGEATKEPDEIPRVTCAVNSQETALYIAVEATKLMKDQMPELLEMTSAERIKKILPLAIDLATMGNMLFEKTQNQINKMFSPGGDLG